MRKSIVALALMAGSAAPFLSGCATLEGDPERLYPVAEEASRARAQLDGTVDAAGLQARYYGASTDNERIYFRNEIVASRMYLIDVEYSAYEAALTSERQKFAFASSVAGQGLNTAGALFTPASTTKILSGLSGAVGATKGYYDSDIVIAKTIQIAEGQMRAQRDIVGKRILQRRAESAKTYPLSAAMSDVEDYYRAGTLNSGLIEAASQSGDAAANAAEERALVVNYATNASTERLKTCLKKPGAGDRLASLLTPRSHSALAVLMYDVTPGGESARADLLARATAAGICP